MQYGKLIGGEIVFAPRKLRGEGMVVYNPPAAMLREQGYKPAVFTEAPEVASGYAAVSGWTETEDQILQTWSVEPEGDLSPEEALDILLGGEGV